ncbi:EpsG family protein, partial [Vibrio splendidus]|uniref:EpsG family protein n=1 Tax=Vibrio splendidus TaxID=29497 RepID=UPI003CE47841
MTILLSLSIYYWSIIVLIFVSVFIFSKNNHISNFAYFSVFLYLTLLSGFRYDVGTDFSNYLHYFYLIELGYDDVAEISFVYLFKFSQFIGLTEQFVFFVLALIISFGFISYFKYFCDKSGFLAIYLFFTVSIFYFASFNLVRQFTAVAIFLFSVRYIIERRMFKYILMILFSSSFHISALLMLPLYFVMNKNYNLK